MTDPGTVMGQITSLTASLDTASKDLYRLEREIDEAAVKAEDAQMEWDQEFNDRLVAFTEPYLHEGKISRLPGEDVRNAFITKDIREQNPELYGRFKRTKSELDRKKAELKRGKDRAARIESQISALQSVLSMLRVEMSAAG